MRSRWLGLGLVASVVTAGVVVASPSLAPAGAAPKVPPPEQQSEQASATARLRTASGGTVRIKTHRDTHLTRFVGATKAHPIPRAKGASASDPRATQARAFLASYGAAFGVEDPAKDLEVAKGTGSSVPFQQVHDGVPVMGGELQVNLDDRGNVLSANGELSPNLDVATEPTVTSGTAMATAHTAMSKYHGAPGTAEADPELWIYDPELLGGPQVGPPRLVWRVTLSADAPKPFEDLVLIDATTGGLALRIQQLEQIKNRQVCNNNNVVGVAETCTTTVRTEGQAATGNADVDKAYDYAGDTYDYYQSKFGRDSLDGLGLTLKSTVKYCPDASHCPYANAYWNGAQMVYGDGFASADDVVGHELTHGVTDFESSLFYYYQSGAINESLSDVFGELIDQGNGKGNDTAGVKWQMGEDLPASIGVIRNMADPTIYGDPDRMGSANYATANTDSGGVHTNSGVNNKAAFLIADGGTFNGQTITGLGNDKMARIYYKTATDLLTSAADYNDLYDALPQACQNLVGTNGITATDCTSVTKSVTATQMNVQPTGATAIEAPVCAAGQSPTYLFNDNLENTGSGNWTKTTTSGSQAWSYPQNPNIFSGFDATYATSGSTNMFGGERSTTSDTQIARTGNVTPPVGKPTYLRFRHAYGLETNYDGGKVEYQVNNSGTWLDAAGLFTDNGYNTSSVSSFGSGQPGFSGDSHGYYSSRVNLSSFAGQPVKFRFRLASDTTLNVLGWFIDDVQVYSCAVATSAPDAPTIGTATAGNAQATVTWTTPFDGNSAITGYTVTPYIGGVAQTERPFGDTATSQVITGLTNGTTYTFKVTATNLIGESAKSGESNAVTPTAPATAPGAPTIGTATAGDGVAGLTWTAPASNGGSAITGYTVTPYIGAVAQTPKVFNDTATAHVITGLTNGTSYTFKVAATNAVGTGTDSAASNAVTPAGVPGAPTIGTATAGNGQAALDWTAPASNGSAITGYTVTPYIGATAQTPKVFNDTATGHTITGLTNGTTYTFKVAASNGVGTGTESAASNAVTPVAVPGTPTIGTATAGDGQASLDWTAPADDGGSAITGYTVTPYIGAAAQAPKVFNDTATGHTITGLTNGTTYTFTVAATSSVGTGLESAASNSVTPAGVPGAPTIGAATAGNGQATLGWTAPANDGGSAITGYTVTPYIGAAAQTPKVFNDTATNHTITGLTNGTSYTFKVAATNAVGTGADSAASNAVTPSSATAPGAPIIGNALPGNGSVALTWLAPGSNGGSAITGYVVTPYIGGVAQTPIQTGSTGTSRTVTGLANGTTYTFTVAAKNAIGTGAESDQSGTVTAGAPAAPGFQSAQPGNASAKVGYTTPANNGSPVTGYVVTPYVGSTAQAPQTFNTTATTNIVTGLDNGTTYTFKIAAINANGTGPQATTNAVVVGAPNAPGFPNANPGTTSVRISWLPSAANGAPLTGYKVTPYIGSAPQPTLTFASTTNFQTITGLASGTNYSFKIAGYNSIGTGPESQTGVVTVGSPGAVGYLSAVPGNGSATLQYLLPPANGAPIISYTVWPVQGTTVLSPQVFNTPSATKLTVTGLTNGVVYTFRVSATNSIGSSPPTSTNAITAGTPNAPGYASAQPGNGTAKVAWFAPSDSGSPITSYTITPYVGTTAGAPQTFNSTATSQVVTGLANGTTYTFKVVATNAVGAGLTGVTNLSIKVGTPTSPNFPSAKPGNASAIVGWGAPAANASPITGYVITPVVGTTALAPQTFNSTATSQTVTGLTNGTTYTFRVAAINATGTGPYSVTAALKVGTPSAPAKPTVVAGVGSVTVSWVAPASNGSALTGYIVTPIKAGVAQAPQAFDASATSRVISGLTAGASYTFTVIAVNGLGNSATSPASNAAAPT